MNLALNIYNRFPAGARSLPASLRGYYLHWWRYDRRTDELVDEFLDRETWSERRWDDWRSERLSFVLETAATRVPFYRDLWEKRRRQGDRASWSYLENWPILEKEQLRKTPLHFVSDDRRPARMFHDHTSGTTGTSLDLWLSRDTVRRWYALFEARARRWYGVTRRDRWAILGGQLVTPVGQKKPPFWVWNAGLNQLYLSSYHLGPMELPAYLEAINRHRVKYILGYPSAIYSLAIESLEQNLSCPRLEVVITNAEPLFEYQRSAISRAFSCPVRETYGMAEIVAAASECEQGSLHHWPDAGIIETENGNGEVSADFICTGLMNADMPLIRYRIGDRGELSNGKCSCGRSLPLIKAIDGRTDDVLFASDGRRVGRLDPVFKGDIRIKEAQIVQVSLTSLEVRIVPSESFSVQDRTNLIARIRERMGDVHIDISEVPKIERTSRGKFKAVICNLSSSERSMLEPDSSRSKPEVTT